MYSKLLTAGLMTFLVVGQVQAQATQPGSASELTVFQDVGEAMTVRQMLTIDATLGLHTEQQRFQDRLKAAASRNPQVMEAAGSVIMTPHEEGPAPQQPLLPPELQNLAAPIAQESSTPALPSVLGVFGLGRHLYADVQLDGSRYRFESGKELPIGAANDFAWRLKTISPPCVVLVSQEGKHEAVKSCISPEGSK